MKRAKLLLVPILLVSFIGLCYWIYIQLDSFYTANNLNVVEQDFDLSWGKKPYTIVNTFASRNYNSTFTVNWDSLTMRLENVTKPGIIGFIIQDRDNKRNYYLSRVKPNSSILSSQRNLNTFSVSPMWLWNENELKFQITDSEIADNQIKNVNFPISTNSLVTTDGTFYYKYSNNRIYKTTKTLEKVNEFEIDNVFTNLKNVKVIKNKLFLLDGSNVYQWTLWDNLLSLASTWSTVLWNMNNNWIQTNYWSSFSGEIILDYTAKWDINYILTDKYFRVINNWFYGSTEIEKIPNNSNYESLLLDEQVLLIQNDWNIDIFNNDLIEYTVTNKSNNHIIYQWYWKEFIMNWNIQWWSIINNLWSKNITDIIKTSISGYKDWKPVFNTSTLNFQLEPWDFTTNTINTELKINKISSVLWEFNPVENLFNLILPISWYGILLTQDIAQEPKLNASINNLNIKVNSWEYYLKINAFDYWYNKSDSQIFGPIIINTNKPNFSWIRLLNPEDWWSSFTWVFELTIDKKITSLNIYSEDNLGNFQTYTLNDFDILEKSEGYWYSFEKLITSWVEKIRFDINAIDDLWASNTVVYEYSVFSGWFQVIWITKSNISLGDINQKTLNQGLALWLSTRTQDMNTNSDIIIQNEWGKNIEIPFIYSSWSYVLDEKKFKFLYPETIWMVIKETDENFIKNDIKLLNWFIYIIDGNAEIPNNIEFDGNWIIIINWDLSINWNVIANKLKETQKYKNNLTFFVTWNVIVGKSISTLENNFKIKWKLKTEK